MSSPPSVVLRSPIQASRTFGSGGAPRQRHTFLVRFQPNGSAMQNASSLSFAVKHCDRPKIDVKTEELSQYNKKRQIITGFKLDPVRITFYDSADGAAQKMWLQYARYHFGDFASDANQAYSGYDVTNSAYNAGPSGMGFSQPYQQNSGGFLSLQNSTSNSAQWFFDSITIYHFYVSGGQHVYDSYELINPRISTYEPDELDYESSAISTINVSIVYENLQYSVGQSVEASAFQEFTSGNFYGNPVLTPGTGASPTSTVGDALETALANQPAASLQSLLTQVSSPTLAPAPYRNASSITTGVLNASGFSFGSNGTIDGATLQNAVLQNTVTLPASAYSLLNANQTGTAQYGYTNAALASATNFLGTVGSSIGNLISTAPMLA